jgi:hypothetical protein
LVRLIDGRMDERPAPMGFWNHPVTGIRTPSREWMSELLEAQKAGLESDKVERLRLDAGEITMQYPDGTFTGHAAWLDWPWKLHRIEDEEGEVRLELYHLAEDPMEKEDLAARDAGRVRSMRSELEAWLASVVRSLNGGDYR